MLAYHQAAVELEHTFGDFVKEDVVDGVSVSYEFWDSSGSSEYDNIRPLIYPRTNVLLIAFSICDPQSLESVATKWLPELAAKYDQSILTKLPIILVGCKSDTRPQSLDINPSILQPDQGKALAAQIGACAYIECSSHTKEGVQRVYESALRAGMKPGFEGLPVPTNSKSRNNTSSGRNAIDLRDVGRKIKNVIWGGGWFHRSKP
uniref:Rho family protein n=1 Tax=Volvariella volvacea TaxID=36659 RepID=A0A1B2U6X5_9AGAR|nr:Rho family protein [Volvariella volvacea]